MCTAEYRGLLPRISLCDQGRVGGGDNAMVVETNVRMMSEIMEVPLPRAASRRLMSFLTFHISICGRTRTYRQHANVTPRTLIFCARRRESDGQALTFFSASLALGSILAVGGDEEEEEGEETR